MTRRRLLQLLAGLGGAGAALFLSAGAAQAARAGQSGAAVPVTVPVVPPSVVPAPVVDAVRDTPLVGPLVTKAGDATHLHPPGPLPIVSEVLAPVIPPASPSSGVTQRVESLGSNPPAATVPGAFSNWRAGADVARRPVAQAIISKAPARSDSTTDTVAQSGLRGIPSGVTAEPQTQSRGDASVAAITSPSAVATIRWRGFDVTSSRAPRPGVARDLSPPG